METPTTEKKSKAPKPAAYAALRVRKDTRKRVLSDLARINKKAFGKRIHADEYISLAVSLVTSDHFVALQEGSLSHADRLERDYRAYVAEHGHISKDQYLGKRLGGELIKTEGSKTDSAVA